MSPSPAGGWVLVKNESVSESGCFIAARLDFQLLGLSTSLKPLEAWKGCSFRGSPAEEEEVPSHLLFTPGLFFLRLFLSI